MFKTAKHRFSTAPWRRVWKVYGAFVLAMSALGLLGSVAHFTTVNQVAQDVGASALVAAISGLYGVFLFTFIWVRSDVPAGWANFKQFFRDLPENLRRAATAIRAAFAWLLSLPGKLWAGICWVASLPGKLRALPARDKKAALLTALMFTICGGIGYLLWPFAAGVIGWLPLGWLDAFERFMFTFVVDIFFAAMLGTLATNLLVVLLRWRRNEGPRN